MKISNNALNFLLAQYRAIFKRAYVKGIASAVLLTAGLAMGQAQAANDPNALDYEDFASGTASGLPAAQIITKGSTIKLEDLDANQVSGGWTYINGQTVDGAAVTINGEDNRYVAVSGNFTVQNGGSFNFINDKNENSLFYGGDSGGNAHTFTVKDEGSSATVTSTMVNFNNVAVTDKATLTIGGMFDADSTALDVKEDKSHAAQWVHFANVYANYTASNTGGETKVVDSTINLNASSILGADGEVKIYDNSTINFNGDWRSIENGTGYATAIIRANKVADSNVTISGSETAGVKKTPTINVLAGKHGAIFAPNINISDTQVNVNEASSLTLDGDWAANGSGNKKTAATEDQHTATNLKLSDVTFDNKGTVIIGNATSGGSGTVTGTVDLQDDVKNFAKVTISGSDKTPGRLIISEDQILKQKDADDKPIAAGWFAGSKSEIVLSGDSFDGAVLQLKGTDSDGLDLNKDITFASQTDVTNSTTAGKIYVAKSGTLAGEHFVLKEALSLPTAGKLALAADTFEIGKADGTLASLSAFGAEAYAAHDRIVLETSGDNTFGIDKALTLNRDYYVQDANDDNTSTLNGHGLIQGDNLQITGSALADGHLDITGGAWRNEGQTLDVYYGTLNVTAGAAETDPVATNDGADSQGWEYYQNGNPASLTWTGNFKFNGVSDSAGSALVNVTGAQGADATLDLTGANVSWGAGIITLKGSIDANGDAYQTSATDYFARAGHGTLVLTGNQFSDYLDLQEDGETTKTQMIVSGGGLVLVKGAVTGPINFNKFTKDSDPVAAGNVHFSGAGMLLSTGDLSLETGVDLNDNDNVSDSGEIKELTLGEGMIGAVGISINNRNPELNEPDADLADDYVTVSGGALGVTSRFDSSNNEVRFVESDLVLDSAGLLSQYGVTSTGSGVAAVNKLTFSGFESDLYVETGDWTVGTGGVLGDIELQDQASVNVGADDGEFARNGIAASLKADNLSIGNGDLTISAGGSATFNTIQAGTGSSITITDGSLTLTGNVTDSDIEAENVPESLADIGTLDEVKAQAGIALNDATITVTHGELVLGDTAASALVKFSATEDKNTGFVAVNDALAEANITLTDASVLKLDFSESSAAAINGTGKISNVQARELKDELVDALERGSYINVGQLGLDIIYDETDMTAQWSDLKDFVHVDSC